jgi:LuxR family maltose regulon positive regulatory protein
MSRDAPPAWLARWQVNQGVTLISPPAIRLEHDEVAGILSLQSPVPINEDTVEKIYSETDGWAAGVVLIHNHINRHGVKGSRVAKESREAMFRYFATQVDGDE